VREIKKEERREGWRYGGTEAGCDGWRAAGRKGEWIPPISETWRRHCTAVTVYRFYFDAF